MHFHSKDLPVWCMIRMVIALNTHPYMYIDTLLQGSRINVQLWRGNENVVVDYQREIASTPLTHK